MKYAFGTLAIILLAACTERDLGTGLNTVEREYAKPLDDAREASLAAVKDSGLTIESDVHDALGADIVARRSTGEEVRITLRSVSANMTRISVRVGAGDSELADLIHRRISEKLGVPAASGS